PSESAVGGSCGLLTLGTFSLATGEPAGYPISLSRAGRGALPDSHTTPRAQHHLTARVRRRPRPRSPLSAGASPARVHLCDPRGAEFRNPFRRQRLPTFRAEHTVILAEILAARRREIVAHGPKSVLTPCRMAGSGVSRRGRPPRSLGDGLPHRRPARRASVLRLARRPPLPARPGLPAVR